MELLHAVQKPKEVAVLHCQSHQKGEGEKAEGNCRADAEAKIAARRNPPLAILTEGPLVWNNSLQEIKPQYSLTEIEWGLPRGHSFLPLGWFNDRRRKERKRQKVRERERERKQQRDKAKKSKRKRDGSSKEKTVYPIPLKVRVKFCLPSQSVFFLCGTSTRICLPTNWTRTCTLVFNIAPGNQTLSVPLKAQVCQCRAIQLIPLLIGLGMATATGTGIASLATSLSYYHTLSKEFSDSLQEIMKSILTLQSQIDSLAAVTLQNCRGLDVLTVEKGGLCAFLGEECFYANQSGIVGDAAWHLQEKASEIRQCLLNSYTNLWSWATWLLPFLVPVAAILLLLTFGPCIFNLLVKFVSSRIKAIKLQMVLQVEPQMSSTNNFYRGPLDRPAGTFLGLESSLLEETTTAGHFIAPIQQEVARAVIDQIPNSSWGVLFREGIER
uniref:Uncharacterized protein n=1 Tax=Macaca mulatta TaxID=9544 RepID=A0A5F7Z9Q8_MACMU